ncbi:hypothetical protein PAPHI01_1051 [Pancytospora philotis]|nr:hypothetical protein PAPHI01_1051 [Pancytospora philotis]
MRGSEHLKAILKGNNKSKMLLVRSYALYTLLVVALYCYRSASLCKLALLSVPDVAAGALLHWITLPTIATENGAAKLVNVVSLNSSGVVAFLFDVMFWGLLCKTLIPFSGKWAILYLGVAFSFFSEFLYKPYKSIKKI